MNKNETLTEALSKLATDDYQKRGGNYPRCNVADSVTVHGNVVTCDFKNTTESAARKWLENHLALNGFKIRGEAKAWQSGDYHDDWVTASATVSGFIR